MENHFPKVELEPELQFNAAELENWLNETSGPQWPITHQWENVKSTQEIECSQYKGTAAILSPSLPFAPFIFSKTKWVIPRLVLHS